MSNAHRLADGGELIDRSEPITFTLNGKEHEGFRGDSLASALMRIRSLTTRQAIPMKILKPTTRLGKSYWTCLENMNRAPGNCILKIMTSRLLR